MSDPYRTIANLLLTATLPKPLSPYTGRSLLRQHHVTYLHMGHDGYATPGRSEHWSRQPESDENPGDDCAHTPCSLATCSCDKPAVDARLSMILACLFTRTAQNNTPLNNFSLIIKEQCLNTNLCFLPSGYLTFLPRGFIYQENNSLSSKLW